MKLILAVLGTISAAAINAVAIPHERTIIGSDECEGEDSGAEYIATFKSDIFVHDTIITIPVSSVAADFVDVEVHLDHPQYKIRPGKPIRCGKKFSRVAARKLESSEIIFVCKGAGKTAALGRIAADARVFIKKRVKKGTTRCINFSGMEFITVQEDVEVWSDWSAWSECDDNQVTRSRTCSGIFCETELETETKDEPCLKCEDGFEPNDETKPDEMKCVDIDECELGRCPENSECTNSIGSYSCTCNEGMYGDDMNFCIVPRACHNYGVDDKLSQCECAMVDLNTTEFVTSWNNTAGECTVEYKINFEQASVHSWYVEVNFDNDLVFSIDDVWRARTTGYGQSDQSNGFGWYNQVFEAMYFNVEQIMDMRFHANFMYDCNRMEGEIPNVIFCSEPVPVPTTVTTTTTTTLVTTTTQPTTEPPTEPALSDEVCDVIRVIGSNQWLNEDGAAVRQYTISVDATPPSYEWRIELPFADSSTTIVTWTAEVTSPYGLTWALTAKEYNMVLRGPETFSIQVIGDAQNVHTYILDDNLPASFCYKTLLTDLIIIGPI